MNRSPRAKRTARLAIGFLAFFLASFASAQTVRWEADPSAPNTVQLVFRDCEPDGTPELPIIPGATLTFLGQSTNMAIVNFEMSRSVTYSYLVRARQSTPVQIPAFSMKTNKGAFQVPAFTVAAPAASVESVASSKLIPEKTTLWAGEVFGITYELSASQRNRPQISPDFEWNPAPLIAEDWTKPEVTEVAVGTDRRLLVQYRTRATAKSPNTLKLEAASHLLSIQTGTIGFGIISQPRMEPISVTSDQPVIQVKPLPTPPAGFSGAVGAFKLASKIVPEKAAIGEPVTWTLELTGTGNWPDFDGLPQRQVSNDFQVVQPKAKRGPVEGKLFDVTLTEDVVLVPTKAGTYTLGPINFSYFDPKSGTYKTISTPRTTLAITNPSMPTFNLSPQATDPAPEPPPAPKVLPPPTVPAAPTGIPRDPLPGSDEVMTPFSRDGLIAAVAAPFAGLLLFWAGLAIRQAHKTDPARARREARARMVRTLSQLANAGEADRSYLLLAWQRDTAILWQISHAAPPATALTEATWQTLWREAERTLYGPRAALPTDWVARAQEALALKRVPGFRPLRAFLPRNLMPFAAVLAVALATIPLLLRAAESDPAAAYRRGDFPAAEKAWRAAVEQRPTDWIARHNLSLALAQQDRLGESAAQAVAAFVQRPDHPSTQWHFGLAAQKSGFAPDKVAAFLKPTTWQSVANAASPSHWQAWIVVAAFAIAIALGVMLANGYGRRARSVYWAASFVVMLSAALAATATAGVLAYGTAADARAIIVTQAGILRSIPTEADTTQKTTPMLAGSIGVADGVFLGWNHVIFSNGQTGWVRKNEIVTLWK